MLCHARRFGGGVIIAARSASMKSILVKNINLSNSVNFPLSKIVATIGPASEQLPVLTQVVNAGMRIMRLNFSHATYEEADLRVKNLRLCPGLHADRSNIDFNLRGN
jgi:pyruvate kinase